MDSQNHMALDVAGSLSVANARQASSEPPNPRRDSQEDADSSLRRKRPRLDVEGVNRRSKSADRLNSAEASTTARPASDASSATLASEEILQKSGSPGQQVLNRAASMVTINVRHPAAPLQDSSSNAALSSPNGGSHLHEPVEILHHKSPSPNPPPIALISSASQSPEIEVAEVEEMDQNENWLPIVRTVGVDLDDLIARFPLSERSQDTSYGPYLVARALDKSEDFQFVTLVKVRDWMLLFIKTLRENPDLWMRLLSDEYSFVSELICVFDALANRRHPLNADFTIASIASLEEQVIKDLLISWLSLVRLYIIGDISLLERAAHEPTDLAQSLSIRALFITQRLCMRDNPLWRMLGECLDIDEDDLVFLIAEHFILRTTDNVTLLAKLCNLCFDNVQAHGDFFHIIQNAVELVGKAISLDNDVWRLSNEEGEQEEAERYIDSREAAVILFQTVDHRLRSTVDRQLSTLTRRYSDILAKVIHGFLYNLAHHNDTLIRQLMGYFMPSDDLNLPLGPQCGYTRAIIAHTWRYQIYHKYIVRGRMEVRSIGVQCLAEFLVEVYTQFKNLDNHPVLTHLASLIVENELVGYLVSSGSHPELISMSANIVGFLIVTERLSEQEVDGIYDRIANSTDQRAVTAILDMLRPITHLMHYPTLLHICTRLKDIPIERFDDSLREHCRDILSKLRDKFNYSPEVKRLDAPVFEICLRLIRDAASDLAPGQFERKALFNDVLTEFKDLLRHGADEEIRQHIYQDCIEHVQSRTPGATGSICALAALLTQDKIRRQEIVALNEKYDFSKLVIDEFVEKANAPRKATPAQTQESALAITSRLDLINLMLTQAPDSIDVPIGQSLWDAMVGHSTLKLCEREHSWHSLSNMTLRTGDSANPFIDKCIKIYLPTLSPTFYTTGALHFTQTIIEYLGRVDRPRDPVEYQIVEIAGADQAWNILLRSPPNGIEASAISYLVKLYLDIRLIKVAPKSSVDATHIWIVTKCVQQLTDSARKLRNSGALEEIKARGQSKELSSLGPDSEELKFSRSLLFLREFLKGLKSRPQFSPIQQRHAQLPISLNGYTGDSVLVKYQVFSAKQTTSVRDFRIDENATLRDLRQRLVLVSGLKQFQAIIGGQYYDLEENLSKTLKELSLNNNPWIILRQRQEDAENSDVSILDGVTVVELELLKHFSDLYALLSLPGDLGNEIWQLLCSFPPQQQIMKMILDQSTPCRQIFSVEHPYKLLYSIFTLTKTLDEQLQKTVIDESFMARGVSLLVQSLTETEILKSSLQPELKMYIGSQMLSCLLRFLKEPVDSSTSASYFQNEDGFVNRLLEMIQTAQSQQAMPITESASMACHSFAILIEASLRNEKIWKQFESSEKAKLAVQSLLLDDMRQVVRSKTADSVRNVCGELPMHTEVSTAAFANFFWGVIAQIIENSFLPSNQSQEFFIAALEVLRAKTRATPRDLAFDQYVHTWGSLLIGQNSHQFVGRDIVNHTITGLIQLMTWCLQSAKSIGLTISTGYLAVHIIGAHLYPELSDSETERWKHERLPVLHSETRKRIQDLVLLLISDLNVYTDVIDLMADLAPEGEFSETQDQCVVDELEDIPYVLSFGFDRTKAIRSPTGYVGLRNLSNTCYLNSLFTQLFMNVGFRKFMLEANVAEANGSQKLLFETKTLFAHMQDSYEKAVEPRGVTDAIKNYENESIDVSIQMDVDEFYNLLFDRWESQMLSPESKKQFRSFYGGQLVQQVKSKECIHISEREEPFSAIQCEIKGKGNLETSLRAYVEGESLEGQNKYSCTSCNRHVDAVKRTCLKEIPENLIFHLKRFEFDLRTMQRSKINDSFDFPTQVDMRPYKVDYLTNPSDDIPPDVFELVGVLIHTGTAESGHYYSLIKERPPQISNPNTWVEFNDSDVSYFDPSFIASYASGGTEEWRQNNAGPKLFFPKNYSAYMLFYERCKPPNPELSSLSRAPVPFSMKRYVALQNELLVRKYCLYDPFHHQFIKSLLDLLRPINKGSCSENHFLEEKTIYMVLDHLDQVFSRMREISDFEAILNSLFKVMGSCPSCCVIVLDFMAHRPDSLRNLLLRCPTPKIKQEISRMISSALRHLKNTEPNVYGLDNADVDSDSDHSRSSNIFKKSYPTVGIVEKLARLFQPLVDLHLRAFDDYFALLSTICSLGHLEAGCILYNNLLEMSVGILISENGGKWGRPFERHHKQLSKGRKISFIRLTELIALLLERIDPAAETCSDSYERAEIVTERWPLTESEQTMLRLKAKGSRNIAFLYKILDVAANVPAGVRIVQALTLAEPEAGQLNDLQGTLISGIHIDPASLAGSFLQAAIAFIRHTPQASAAREVIGCTAREIETIGSHGGREHIDFFKGVAMSTNDRLGEDDFFFKELLIRLSTYWAPVLLLFWETDVREDTQVFIMDLFFGSGNPPQTGDDARDELIADFARKMMVAILDAFVNKYVEKRQPFTQRAVDAGIGIIDVCESLFDKDDADDAGLLNRKHAVVSALRENAMEEDLEDNASEWADNDSGIASDSSEIDPNHIIQNISP